MTSFEVYCEYLSIKTHFTKSSYDYTKYNGKGRYKLETFQKRKDKLFFEKIAKHSDPHGFFIANIIINDKVYIRDLAYSEEAEKIYKKWLKYNQALTYNFKQDLSKLDSNFNKNFICEDHQHPILLKKYLANEISLETLCILLDITGAINHWNKELNYDLVWEEIELKVKKYLPFIKYEKEKYKKISLDLFA